MEKNKNVIVIPSYWGRKSKEKFNPEDDVYDHPTPLDETGTLERALASLKILKEKDFTVVIIGVATNPELEKRCNKKLRSIVKKFKDDLDILLFNYDSLNALRDYAGKWGDEDLAPILSLNGYSNVRNMCLLSVLLLGGDTLILFDDDEIMVDPNYMTKAVFGLRKEMNGNKVLGKAGYYLRPEGDHYLIPEKDEPFEAVWGCVDSMNKAFGIIDRLPRLKPTPFAFGGNMVLDSGLVSRVSFDPFITRGEDIDYIFNCRLFGYEFFLDNELYIKHLPPDAKGRPCWMDLRQNIYRFIYMREKLRAQNSEDLNYVAVERFDPYPGRFLKDDLDDLIFKASTVMALDCLDKGDREGFKESLENLTVARFKAKPSFNPLEKYLNFQNKWYRLTTKIIEDYLKIDIFK